MRIVHSWSILSAGIVASLLAGCGSAPKALTAEEKSQLDIQVAATIADFKNTDPDIDRHFRQAYAYAVFPEIKAAAVVVGGAHGNGEVFRAGQLTGYADVSKGNVGAQLGGQSYSQVVFFENEGTYANFIGGTMELDAKASAVAAAKGASTNTSYERGVMVFTQSKGGLMVQAAIGGQKFRFSPR